MMKKIPWQKNNNNNNFSEERILPNSEQQCFSFSPVIYYNLSLLRSVIPDGQTKKSQTNACLTTPVRVLVEVPIG